MEVSKVTTQTIEIAIHLNQEDIEDLIFTHPNILKYINKDLNIRKRIVWEEDPIAASVFLSNTTIG